MLKFMPSDFRLIEARRPPLKDLYDEWLARWLAHAFDPSVLKVSTKTKNHQS